MIGVSALVWGGTKAAIVVGDEWGRWPTSREVRHSLPPKAQQLIYTSVKRALLPSCSKKMWTFSFYMLRGKKDICWRRSGAKPDRWGGDAASRAWKLDAYGLQWNCSGNQASFSFPFLFFVALFKWTWTHRPAACDLSAVALNTVVFLLRLSATAAQDINVPDF